MELQRAERLVESSEAAMAALMNLLPLAPPASREHVQRLAWLRQEARDLLLARCPPSTPAPAPPAPEIVALDGAAAGAWGAVDAEVAGAPLASALQALYWLHPPSLAHGSASASAREGPLPDPYVQVRTVSLSVLLVDDTCAPPCCLPSALRTRAHHQT